jgi:hypothetical protein
MPALPVSNPLSRGLVRINDSHASAIRAFPQGKGPFPRLEKPGGSLLDTLSGLWNIDINILISDERVQKDLPYDFTIGMFR